MNNDKIETLYNDIYEQLFTINGRDNYSEMTAKLIELAGVVSASETDESTWWIGEYNEACLADLIVGAYWHYADWHAGQHSDSYAALSALGAIFSPGMSCGVDGDTGEQFAYDELESLAKSA